jgi:putative flippase GtrA
MMPIAEQTTQERAGGLDRLMPQLSRYVLASAMALATDFGSYVALVHGFGLAPAAAGAIGYSLGLWLHFNLSTRFVFEGATTKTASRLLAEFIASGLVGLLLTILMIWVCVTLAGLPPVAAKLAAIAASFLAVYALRRQLVFR